MQEMNCFYPVNPDKNGKYFEESAIQDLANSIIEKPQIFASNSLKLDVDLAIPVGVVTQLGFSKDPVTNLEGLVIMYTLTEEIFEKLIDAKTSLIGLHVEPYIIGLVDTQEDKNYLIGPRVTNLSLTI